MTDEKFNRGEVWLTSLDQAQAAESSRARLAIIVSTNVFNNGPAELVIVLPLTTRKQGIPLHVKIQPPEGGSNRESYILCERIHCISRNRLIKKLGQVEESTMNSVDDKLAIILNLFPPN